MKKQITAFAIPALLFASFALLYADVIVNLVRDWAMDDNYSHGFLIVPIALYLVWERRERLAVAFRQPKSLGLVVVLGSLMMLIIGVLGSELFASRVSLVGLLAGTLLFVCGWQHLRVLAFLLLMIPIPAIIFNQILTSVYSAKRFTGGA